MPSKRRFATTQWTLVRAAAGEDSPSAADALSRLCSMYWFPVFAFVRRRGYSVDEAEDLTQGFFARIIEMREIGAADRDRGRFRTFLLTACEHFLLNERDRAHTLKRGGGAAHVSIDILTAEQQYQRSLVYAETPERLYQRQWCLALLATVVDSLRDEYVAAGNGALFDRLRGFLSTEGETSTHAGAAADLGMTPAAVKVAVHRLRRRYRERLRQRIADTVDSAEAVDDEMRDLLNTLSV